MNDHNEQERRDRKVHVTALYTSTAETKKFVSESEETVRQVIDEAYRRLGESPRSDDQYFCHDPRIDLGEHFATSLEALAERGVCVNGKRHGRLELEIDIDVTPGGA